MTTLVFTLGPVQGFIAQSRRTADGWVGSFLLSYLSCHAALELGQHGDVVDPDLSEIALYEALRRGTAAGVPGDLRVAGCPNNIVVELREGESPRDAGDLARQAVERAWRDVEGAVWGKLPDEALGPHVERLWRRQTTGFWESYWAWGASSTAAFDALVARKGLRDFEPIEEGGERCTLCAEREALWNEHRAEKQSLRAAVQGYWRRWAEFLRGTGTSRSAIKDDGSERLCAICVVKRLVPWLDPNPVSDLWRDRDAIFPSTSTMATLRAKAALVRAAYHEPGDDKLREALEAFVGTIGKQRGRLGRRADPPGSFRAWRQALAGVRDPGQRDRAERFLGFDGDCLLYGPSVQREQGLDAPAHERVRQAHRDLLRAVPKDASDAVPSIYWALLAMDGDHMGQLMRGLSESGPPARVRQASGLINRFARRVPQIVDDHDGRLVYAGGDDVLALLPVDTALQAAEALRRAFAALFCDWFATFSADERGELTPPTLSGALVYAHHQTPLGRVVERAQHLLKHEAKDRAGRNALAVEVRTRAGESVGFAARWVNGSGEPLAERLQAVVDRLKGRQVASRFLYELQGLAHVLRPGADGVFSTADDRRRFVASLAEKTRLVEKAQADETAGALLALVDVREGADPDLRPLLFARFLATGGREAR